MDSTPRPTPRSKGVPATAGNAGDYIAVDDSGAFSYYESGQKLLAAFEYVGEASIIDRAGNSCDLALDPNRELILGPGHGPAEFHWLRQAWLDAQQAHPEEHRLRRFYPKTPDRLLTDLFETLALEHGAEPGDGIWTLDADGLSIRRHELKDIDRRLSGQDQLENVRVRDPFNHVYQPARQRKHWHMPAAAPVLYIEIPADNIGFGV